MTRNRDTWPIPGQNERIAQKKQFHNVVLSQPATEDSLTQAESFYAMPMVLSLSAVSSLYHGGIWVTTVDEFGNSLWKLEDRWHLKLPEGFADLVKAQSPSLPNKRHHQSQE